MSTRKTVVDIPIHDFAKSVLQGFKDAGYKAIAHLSDGTEEEVEWDTVTDPTPDPTKASYEAASKESETIAKATNQHFYADDNGVHVTETESTPNSGHNILVNAKGILLRVAEVIACAMSASGITVYDGQGNDAGNVRAIFANSGGTIGTEKDVHTTVDQKGLKVYDSDGTESAQLSGDECFIGKNNKIILEAPSNSAQAGLHIVLKGHEYIGGDADVFSVTTQLAQSPAAYSAQVRIGAASFAHATIDRSGLNFYNTDGSTILASFAAALARIGKSTAHHVDIDSTGMSIKEGDTTIAKFAGDSINLGGLSNSAKITMCNQQASIAYQSSGGWSGMYISSDKGVGLDSGSGGASLLCKNEDRQIYAAFSTLKIYGNNYTVTYGVDDLVRALNWAVTQSK